MHMRYRNVAVGLLVVLALAVGAYFYFLPTAPSAPAATALFGDVTATPALNDAVAAAPRGHPEGWEEYYNNRYGFSLFHPPQQKVQEFDEGGGAMTITFEDATSVSGFQIFVVPYSGLQITEDRFIQDVPSGVRTNVENTYVGGARAVTFNSYNALLGDTREVWFIRNGYLYEVTTFKGDTDWFTPTMQSWSFL